jgi:hypothetical protein
MYMPIGECTEIMHGAWCSTQHPACTEPPQSRCHACPGARVCHWRCAAPHLTPLLPCLLQTVWKDPICGDGICETPFEFASYGRFGCRADCGMLSQVQNLTTIQVDLYYDFSHPLGSVASSVGGASRCMPSHAASTGVCCRGVCWVDVQRHLDHVLRSCAEDAACLPAWLPACIPAPPPPPVKATRPHSRPAAVQLHSDAPSPPPRCPISHQDLMDQASWNLCPQQTPFSGDCYFDTDQQFESITGEQHVTIDDAPDGSWNLLVKRDIFDKVGVGVKGRSGKMWMIRCAGDRIVGVVWLAWMSLAIGQLLASAASAASAEC